MVAHKDKAKAKKAKLTDGEVKPRRKRRLKAETVDFCFELTSTYIWR